MQIPVRLSLAFRPSVSTGALLAISYSTFVLGATPFLLGMVADHYNIGLAAASLIGVGQLGGFVFGSWGAGRWLTPTRRVFVFTLMAAVVANFLSSFLPMFPLLVALRFGSGVTLGLVAWFAWSQVFGDQKGMGDIAVMGPIAGMVASPVIALLAVRGGMSAIFTFLTVVAAVPLLFNRGTEAVDRVASRSARSSPVPAAAIMLVALGLFTLGGSAAFSYAVVIGMDKPALTTGAIAVLFSLNALAGMPAAKWPWSRGIPGPWLAVTGCCAIAVTTGGRNWIFAIGVVTWGFAFWMALPGVFSALAERSANPADRAGDAQAIMAAGRVGGPLLGGLLLDNFGTAPLGAVSGGLMIGAAVAVFTVRNWTPPRETQQLATSGACRERP